MSALILCAGVGAAILLESLASPRSNPPRAQTALDSDQTLRALALAASVLLLSATLYAGLRATAAVPALVGAGLIVVGGSLRAAAMHNLGSQFRTEAGADELVTTGIHAVMRHPSELGLLCWTLGLFVTAPTLLAGLLASAQLPFLVARLRIEERVLAARFSDRWLRYASRTPRLGV